MSWNFDYARFAELARQTLPVRENMILSDMTIAEVDALQGAKAVLKKLEDLVAADAGPRAIDKFFDCNEACKTFVLRPKRLYDDVLIETVKNTLDNWLHPDGVPLGWADFARNAALGTGSNIGCTSKNFYSKLFDSQLTCSSETVYRLYRMAISLNPTWAQAEELRFQSLGIREVCAGSITTVPKQFDIMRTVITEATCNMWFQRGIAVSLDGILKKRLGICLTSQPDLNREMARLGSLDGRFGTIDLSSASDRIALSLVRELFPRYFTEKLELLRTTHVRRPDGRVEELHMISSMGNGYTFSLQTMLFAAIVVSCYSLLGVEAIRPRPHIKQEDGLWPVFRPGAPGNYGVFGDDIIVCREAYDYVCQALELFGFVVNADKSFNTGDFRESCGADYYRGHLVRGLYVKNLRDETDCYSAMNRLVAWTARTGIDTFPLYDYLSRHVRYLPVPPSSGDSEGIKVPRSCVLPRYLTPSKNRTLLYAARVVEEEGFHVPLEPGDKREQKIRKTMYHFRYNAPGLTVALVGGFIRDGRIVVPRERGQRKRSKVRLRSVPFWDYVPNAPSCDGGDSWSAVAGRYALKTYFQKRA